MKSKCHYLSIATLLLTSSLCTNTLAGEIQFDIAGVNQSEGKIYVQLFKGESNYKNGKANAATIVTANKGKATVSFNNIASGEYALRFFHDENDNGKMETNLLGIPTEGYGFSNNAKPNFGPVAYKEIKFIVSADSTKVINKTQVIY